jgi:hypothetical protein
MIKLRYSAYLFAAALAGSGWAQTDSGAPATSGAAETASSGSPASSWSTGPAFGPAQPVPLAGTSQLGAGINLGSGAMLAGEDLLRWGPLKLHPHLTYRVSYATDLQPASGELTDTMINEFSPGLAINIGENWTLDYTPNLRWYSDNKFDDGVDHAVLLSGKTRYEAWVLGLSQGFSLTSQPLVETAAQTDQELWNTSLSAGYAFNSKLSLDMTLNQNLRYIEGEQTYSMTDSYQWSTMEWLNYQYAPSLTFSVGGGVTYEDIKIGSDMLSGQLQGRIMWRSGSRLDLTFSGGADMRSFLDSDKSGTVSPIFSLSAHYKLFEQTSLFVVGSRTVSPSYYQNTLTGSTGISAGINQRLLGVLNLSVSGGYTLTDYSGTSSAGVPVAASQDYNSASFSASLGTTLLQRVVASVFYSATFNKSDLSIYNYTPQTVGLELSTRF